MCRYIIPLLCLLALISCTDDDDMGMAVPCEQETVTTPVENYDSIFPAFACVFGWQFSPAMDYDYTYPTFNPNDPMEIAYIRKDNVNGQPRGLWKFNLCTGEKKLLADNALGFTDWSIKDWIVYTGTGNQLFKVKSNGDSLTQISNAPGTHKEAKWNDAGDKLAYIKLSGEASIFLADENGNAQDSIFITELTISGLNWKDGKITGINWVDSDARIVGIGEFDFIDKQFVPIDILDLAALPDSSYYNSTFPHVTAYIGEGDQLFYSSKHQMYVYDIATRTRRVVATGADNRQYDIAEVSPDGKTVIYSRRDLVKLDENGCFYDYTELLYLIDIDGGNERLIEIPE